MVRDYSLLLVGLILLQRVMELYLAASNRKWALKRGAIEYGARHYPLFFLLHAGWLTGWVIEANLTREINKIWYIWFLLFLSAQGLRYWAIASLGPYWNTRILVIPGAGRVRRGPYRILDHPNYLAVALELLTVPLIFNAWVTALCTTVCNLVLLLKARIPIEERAIMENMTDDV